MSCMCQECHKPFKVDLLIDDDIWKQITPNKKIIGAGLLCGRCIIDKIEHIGKYDAFKLIKI